MAVSFGGHPTLQAFVDEAQRLGCRSVVETRRTRAGRTYNALVVTSADNSKLTIVDPEFTERLPPSVVSSYERRLGIRTRFASLPQQPPKSARFNRDDDEG